MPLEALVEGSPSRGEEVIAFDDLGAGPGALIGLSEGREAANPFGKTKTPDRRLLRLPDRSDRRSERDRTSDDTNRPRPDEDAATMAGNGNADERMEAPRADVRDRPAGLRQGLRRRQRRQHQLPAQRGPRPLHADPRLEGLHEARRPLHRRPGRQAGLGQAEAVERDPAAPVDHEGAARRQVVRPLPPAPRHGVRRRPRADPQVHLPEFEVFLGEVAIAPYETPGAQAFADTVLPYVKDTDTILLANHGTITYGSDLEDAYFKTEIIDAYCRILILAKQLGPVNYYSDEKAAELIKLKPSLGIPDPRLEQRPGELRPLRQQPLPRGLHRLQARAQGVHPGQAPAAAEAAAESRLLVPAGQRPAAGRRRQRRAASSR